MLKSIFYLSGLLSVYSYFLYPVILGLIRTRAADSVQIPVDRELPTLSLIITVHNEAVRIGEKIQDTLDIDYPRDLLDIIVASDCSTDDTDRIVQSYSGQGVRLVRADERKGKEYAQLCAINKAKGEILVFSDVATSIPVEAINVLASKFSNKQVGALSSEDRFLSKDGELAGEGAYVKYEMWLRRLESARAGLVGLSGSFFAARKEVCEDWDIHSPSDFITALNCAKKRMVAITCPEVVGMYSDIKDARREYQRKIRTVIRGMTAIARHPEVINPFRMGLFAFQVWSHKIMRWGVPWFMLLFAIATLMLQGQGLVYSLALWAQVAFYGLALAGWLSVRMRNNALVRIIFFFVQTNLAIAQATLAFLTGKRMTVWAPSRR
ncbi:MAG: glycosyltransferase [Gammaproteobacteria bacterium]|nr:glycosyltransferase [Gammaproteobacteria bacterium]